MHHGVTPCINGGWRWIDDFIAIAIAIAIAIYIFINTSIVMPAYWPL
jgi:hypothetical protein